MHICVGAPPEPAQVSAFSLLAGRKSLAGSGIGGIKETQEMLDFCAANNIVSDIEIIDIKDIHTAYDRMVKGDVQYRLSLIWRHYSSSFKPEFSQTNLFVFDFFY